MEMRNDQDLQDRLGELHQPVMAPTFNNMKTLSLAVGQSRIEETFRRHQAQKERVYQGTLLHSLANLEKSPEATL